MFNNIVLVGQQKKPDNQLLSGFCVYGGGEFGGNL